MTMTRFEKRIARGVYDAMFPGDEKSEAKTDANKPRRVGVADGDIEGFLDELAASWEWIAFTTLRASFWVVAIASIFIARSLSRFDRLPLERRLRVLRALYTSDNYFVRQLVTMQKATAGFLYGAMVRNTVAPGRAPEVDHAFVAWRKLVPAHRSHAEGAGDAQSNKSSKEAA
ncbi:MAG: hypothetical protein U0269_27570 [Polyangiales bacterium]